MIVVCNRIPVNPEFASAFEDRFADRSALVENMPGFVAFQLCRPSNPEDPYIVMTFWQDEASFKAWTQSPEFKEGHARSGQLPREAFLGHPKVEVHEVLQSTAKIESLKK